MTDPLRDVGAEAVRRIDLAFHRLRVGHGIPRAAQPLTRWLDRFAGPGFDARERARTRAEAEAVRRRFAGQRLELSASRLPPEFRPTHPIATLEVPGASAAMRCTSAAMTPEVLRELATYLRTRGLTAVRALPISRILSVLDLVSQGWLDPNEPRRALAIEGIHRVTGFSREMVIRSIDLEMRASRGRDLRRTLWSELGNPRVLDRRSWAPTGEAPVMAFGPALVAGVFSSNIPALPHLTYMRALAVKSPVVGKVATLEPIFTGLYLDSLCEACPALAPALAAVWFPGGTRDLEQALFADAGAVIAYGSDASLEAIDRLVPSRARRTMHAHRMGIGLIGREELEGDTSALAEKIAYDFAMFDGQACLAPVAYFVEAEELDEAAALARKIGAALDALARWLPRRSLSAHDEAARRHIVETWDARRWFATAPSEVVCSSDRRFGWAGLVTGDSFVPQPLGDRLFHLHCVRRLEDVPTLVAPWHSSLQNVAMAVGRRRRAHLGTMLAAMGASRVCEPGRMSTPSMMWHHDGRSCLADMVRWADLA